MTDIALLKEHISASGMTMVSVAKRAKIGRVTLYNRLNGKGEFNASEIMGLSKALGLKKSERDKIFLSNGSM